MAPWRGYAAESASVRLGGPFVVTQLPAAAARGSSPVRQASLLRDDYGQGARLLVVSPDGSTRPLSEGFHSACDPAVSFDAKRILFAGKRAGGDDWNIFEIHADGSGLRQVTRGLGDCRSPGYQSTLYTIVSSEPWYQLTFVGSEAGETNEADPAPATNLYSCRTDGSSVRRLTYNLSSDLDPWIMWDGRLLFASWQRSTLDRGPLGRITLFGVNIDGTDLTAFCQDRGERIQWMPCTTPNGLAVFVETDVPRWDGAGRLACVSLRRPLHSYRPLSQPGDGLFHSPSPLPDGQLLVARRPADGSGTHGVWRFDPASGESAPVFDDPRYHEIQARILAPRDVPDGRSSIVNPEDPNGKLYCLNVYTSDLQDPDWMPQGSVSAVRVLEGLAPTVADWTAADRSLGGIPPLAARRILGEAAIEADGSFNVEIPANLPIELQLLDADGLALRSCGWIWARNREPRGCVGCHEDGELTPENWLVDALRQDSVLLTRPPEKRPTVDFRRHVMPIVEAKCLPCHGESGAVPRLDGPADPAEAPFHRAYAVLLGANRSKPPRETYIDSGYVRPGCARTSPLVWHVLGRNTSRPWDGPAVEGAVKPIPPQGAPELTDEEKRTLIRWIDLGARW